MTLVERDDSGVFIEGPDETELPGERTRSFRKFRLADAPDGRRRFRIGGSVGPVHYRLDPWDEGEQYKEIDLSVELTPGEDWDAACETNGYQVRLWQSRDIGGKTVRYIAQFRRAGAWFGMAPLALIWTNAAGERQLIGRPAAGIAPTIDNDSYTVTWPDCFGSGLHFRYNLRPDHFFKTVIIDHKTDLPAPTIALAGLRLVLVMTVAWGGASPANAFAAGHEPEDLDGDGDLSGTADEELDDPEAYAQVRPDGKEAHWLHRPRAWDSAEEPHDVPVQWRLQRRGSRVLALLGVEAEQLNAPQAVYPVFVDASIPEEQVGASTDDARNMATTWPGTAYFNATNTSDRLGIDASYYRMWGARFQTVPIPASATIDSAIVSVRSKDNTTTDTDVMIAWDNAAGADPPTFESGVYEPKDTYTNRTTGLQWDIGIAQWWANDWYDTVELASDFQDVIDNEDWASGQAIACVVWNPNVAKANAYRDIYQWDQAGNVSGAKFNCSYSEPGGTVGSLMKESALGMNLIDGPLMRC